MPSAYGTATPAMRQLQLRIPGSLVERVDEWGEAGRLPSRSEAIRTLITRGLEAEMKEVDLSEDR